MKLARLSRSSLGAASAASAVLALLAAGCAGPRWPGRVGAIGDRRFVEASASAAGPVHTIDVMPIDLQVWTGPQSGERPDVLYRALGDEVSGAVAARLAAAGYQVIAQMGWDGRYVAPDGMVRIAMDGEQLAQTACAMSGYGEAQLRVRDGLLVPYLPARLGTATGSDATLYVGGWAFAGKDTSAGATAGQIAIGVLAVALIAVVVIAVVAGSKHGGGGGGGGSALSGAGHAIGNAASGVADVAMHALQPVGRIAAHTAAAMARDPDLTVRTTLDLLDALGRSDTHLVIYDHRPDYYREGGPHGGRSAMMLDMTLIDNRTGLVLWHARQRFPARPHRSKEVERAVSRLLAPLPAAR